MPEITNDRLLKEIRGINARLGDVMRRLEKMEITIITESAKAKPVKVNDSYNASINLIERVIR